MTEFNILIGPLTLVSLPAEQSSQVRFTFEGGGHRLCGAEGVCVRKGPLPCVTDGLYSEAVAAGLDQPLDLVCVAGTAVDRHKPAQTTQRSITKDVYEGRI